MFKKTLVLVAAVSAVAIASSTALAHGPNPVAPCPKGTTGHGECVYKCPPGITNLSYCVAYKCPPGVTNLAYCTLANPNPSHIKLLSKHAVISTSGNGSVKLDCEGPKYCTGVLKITYKGTVIANKQYGIPGESTGTVKFKLTALGLSELKAAGSLVVTVSAVDTDGPSATGSVTLFYG